MLILKGGLLVLALFFVVLVAFMVAGRNAIFDVNYFIKTGTFLIGFGLGITVVGSGLWCVGHAVLVHFARVAH